VREGGEGKGTRGEREEREKGLGRPLTQISGSATAAPCFHDTSLSQFLHTSVASSQVTIESRRMSGMLGDYKRHRLVQVKTSQRRRRCKVDARLCNCNCETVGTNEWASICAGLCDRMGLSTPLGKRTVQLFYSAPESWPESWPT